MKKELWRVGGMSFREKKEDSFQVQRQSFSLHSVYQLGQHSQREYSPALIGVIQLPISLT